MKIIIIYNDIIKYLTKFLKKLLSKIFDDKNNYSYKEYLFAHQLCDYKILYINIIHKIKSDTEIIMPRPNSHTLLMQNCDLVGHKSNQ